MPRDFNSKNLNSVYDAMHSSIKRIGIIQTNLDNVKTTAFKSIHPDSVLFTDVLNDVFRDEREGAMQDTGRKLDLSLSKANAFFLVDGPNGPERTRDGNFFVNPDGEIVNHEGKQLVILDRQGTQKVFEKLPQTENLEINPRGDIYIDNQFAGRVAIEYSNRLPGETAYLMQGKLESSNVDLGQNLIRMVELKRHVDTLQGVMAMEMSAEKGLIETYGRNV